VRARLPGGIELAYDETGRGTALLLVHGWPHDRTLWAGQSSGLATQARVLAPDLRGFGGSTVAGPWSIDRYADDLAAFLDALDVARAVVCGLSMGGYVALAMLRRHPARVRALILADTRATADTAEGREKRARLIEFAERNGVTALADQQLRSQVGSTTFETRPELCESLRRMMASAPLEGVVGAQRAMSSRADSTPYLPAIALPTLVVGGVEDGITPPDELRALAAGIPDSRLELITSAGHVAPFERPAAFNHLVSEFLRTLPDE
jgi:pimeloyl-ACP methyl ester carboxylesterase